MLSANIGAKILQAATMDDTVLRMIPALSVEAAYVMSARPKLFWRPTVTVQYDFECKDAYDCVWPEALPRTICGMEAASSLLESVRC